MDVSIRRNALTQRARQTTAICRIIKRWICNKVQRPETKHKSSKMLRRQIEGLAQGLAQVVQQLPVQQPPNQFIQSPIYQRHDSVTAWVTTTSPDVRGTQRSRDEYVPDKETAGKLLVPASQTVYPHHNLCSVRIRLPGAQAGGAESGGAQVGKAQSGRIEGRLFSSEACNSCQAAVRRLTARKQSRF